MSPPSADPYAQFLAGADVATWRDCLDRVVLRMAEQQDDGRRPALLAQALCMTIYLHWLSRFSGDLHAEREARRCHDSLRAELYARSGTHSAPAWNVCWGLVLGWDGYRARAAQLLEQDGRIAPEHVPIVLEDTDIGSLAQLRRLFQSPAGCGFLPVLYMYGERLVAVGAVHEALSLVGNHDRGGEPLLLDVRGSAGERLGRWDDAYTAYSRSPWPVHRVRAAMVGAIAGTSGKPTDHLVLDDPVRQVIGDNDRELDQSEITRRTAFLHACLQQSGTSWLVELELGKLSSRQRRYTEADLHFHQALRNAPQDARYAIAQLRFSNLTWVSDERSYSPLRMLPEACTAGWEALALNSDPVETAGIRIWMACESGDLRLIPASLGGLSARERGEAYDAVLDTGRALDAWLDSLAIGYSHRCASSVLKTLGKAGFSRSALHLAGLVLSESADDFLSLWETAESIEDLGPDDRLEADTRELLEVKKRFHERIVELSQFDFKNAIRAYELVARIGHHGQAEDLLLRAARQAESVSELLAVAALRRRVRAAPTRQEGLRCLTRARREARHRLERLQVAYELFCYGQIRDARALLVHEGVFAGDQPLTHVEMIVVLRCRRWLTDQEVDDLVHRAVRRLNLDHRSGELGEFGRQYGERLLTVCEDSAPLSERISQDLDSALVDPLPGTPWPGRSDDDWEAIRDRIDKMVHFEHDERALDITACLGSADPAQSFGLRFAICDHLRERMHQLLAELRRDAPALPAEETPISKRRDPGVGTRTIQLCDLWRARLTAAPGDDEAQAVSALQVFLDTEQALLRQWESRRRQTSAPKLRRTLRVAEALRDFLDTLLGSSEREHAHPVLRSLFRHIDRDVAAFSTDVAERIEELRRELADVPATEPGGNA
ncbi:hypothetical protein ACFXAE_26015 [Streptomyces sp. NPDC059454]|uniref:hypothetical protein n=1 Tax=Streptomyces sp. NPDC059454 TaxID=3346836 RepID=UPI0036B714E3